MKTLQTVQNSWHILISEPDHHIVGAMIYISTAVEKILDASMNNFFRTERPAHGNHDLASCVFLGDLRWVARFGLK